MTRKPHNLLDWERQAIVDAYCAGEKVDAIAAEFNVSKQYPGMLAESHGRPRRKSGRPKKFITSFTCSSVSAVRLSPVIG